MGLLSARTVRRAVHAPPLSCAQRYKQLQAHASYAFKLDELARLKVRATLAGESGAESEPPDLSGKQTAHLTELYMRNPSASVAYDVQGSTQEAQCATLKNGVRVVADSSSAAFCAAGVLVHAGMRNELTGEEGSTYVLEKLALRKTRRLSEVQLQDRIHELGGTLQVTSSRDSIFYSAAVLPQGLGALFELFGSMILEPPLDDDASLDEASQKLAFDLVQMREKPDEFLNELAHVRMFGGRGLGISMLLSGPCLLGTDALLAASAAAPTDARFGPVCSKASLHAFHERMFRPENIIVGAVGISLDELVRVAERTFGHLAPHPFCAPTPHRPSCYSAYAGGPLYIEDERLASSWLGLSEANPYPGHVHFLLALPSCPAWHRDIYPMAVLHSLLGGGSSFSSGGPGKGIYSRLYARLLNRYGYIESAHAVQGSYDDSGFFGMAVNCAAGSVKAVLPVVIRELFSMAEFHSGSVPSYQRALSTRSTLEHTKFDAAVELQRAKSQVKSQLLMGMESRLAQLENLLKDMSIVGQPMSRRQLLSGVDAVSFADLKQVRSRLLSGQVLPTFVAVGPCLDTVPSFSQLLEMIEEQRLLFHHKY